MKIIFLSVLIISLISHDRLMAAAAVEAVADPSVATAGKKIAANPPEGEGASKNMVGLRIADPEGIKIQWDVAYLPTNRAEKCDLYLPVSSPVGKLRPALVIIHGGGFNDGDKARGREINFCTNLAANGYVCMSINYKLSRPNARQIPTWPQSVYDAKSAVRWLRQNSERLQIDPSHIGAMGGSAGGNLAAMLATTGPADGLEPEGADTNFSSRVSCAVDFYGAVNLLEYHDMKMFSKSRAEAPELYEKASPVNYVNPGDAPLLIAHGTLDTVVSIHQSESLAAAYKKAGVPCDFVIIPGAVHTFNLEPSQKDLRPVVMAFLAQHLKPEAKAAR